MTHVYITAAFRECIEHARFCFVEKQPTPLTGPEVIQCRATVLYVLASRGETAGICHRNQHRGKHHLSSVPVLRAAFNTSAVRPMGKK